MHLIENAWRNNKFKYFVWQYLDWKLLRYEQPMNSNPKLEKQQFTHKNDLGFDFLINAMVMKFQGAESEVCI